MTLAILSVSSMALMLTLICSALVYGQTSPSGRLESEFIRTTVDTLATVIRREYMDPDVAVRVDTYLRRRVADGVYVDAATPEALARALTADLFAETKDKHLAVNVIRDVPPDAPAARSDGSRLDGVRRSNAGVRRVEILAGNVGYLELTSFWRLEEARETIAAAMALLRQADALILDQRHNAGGSPDTAAFLASYFFDTAGLPLFEIVHRSGASPTRYATTVPALSGRDERRPVYVLTAARTFSAGEGLVFLLQERRRVEVIGETTAGAANPGRPYPVNHRFDVTVPNGRVKSAVTGGNWEGAGVKPDVAVAEKDALRVAHARALRQLLQNAAPGGWRDRLERELRGLEGQATVR
jgi:C-terminal processing protease CtpA/Prc